MFPPPEAVPEKPIVLPTQYITPPPKIGIQAGHPTKNEMDTLDALYRLAYRDGYSGGWGRAELERVKADAEMAPEP